MAYKMGNLNKGLILHLPLDQVHKQGANYADISASGYPGTPVNAPTATTDRFGRENMALAFNGTNQYLQLPAAAFNLQTITMSVWVKSSSTQSGQIIDIRDASNDGIALRFSIAGNAGLLYQQFSAASTVTILDGLWHHILGVAISGATAQMHIDGAANGAPTDISTAAPVSVTTPARIGQNAYIAGNFVDGSLADIRIYNRALSPGEVQAIYRLGGQYHGNMIIRP